MRNVDRTELASGLLVAAVGACFLVVALDYEMGTVTRMGPGFVPFWLGVIAVLLGAVIAFMAVGRSGALPEIAWRQAGSILLAILVFGLLLPRLGLIVAIFMTAVVSIGGNTKATPRMIVITSALISLVCWVIFIAAIGLPIDAWVDPF